MGISGEPCCSTCPHGTVEEVPYGLEVRCPHYPAWMEQGGHRHPVWAKYCDHVTPREPRQLVLALEWEVKA